MTLHSIQRQNLKKMKKLVEMGFNLYCFQVRLLSVSTRKFPTKGSKNRLVVALRFWFLLVGVTKIGSHYDSLEVE